MLSNGSGVYTVTHTWPKTVQQPPGQKLLLVVTGVRCGAQAQIRCKVGGTGGLY